MLILFKKTESMLKSKGILAVFYTLFGIFLKINKKYTTLKIRLEKAK